MQMANMRTGGFLGIENKFKDYELTASTIVNTVAGSELNPIKDASGAVTPGCLNAVAQGDGESTRDGRRYKMNSLHIKGRMILPGTSDKGSGAEIRLAVILDTQANGATMNAEDAILASPTTANAVYSFRNLQYSGRFYFLHDKVYTLNRLSALGNGTANDSNDVIRHFELNFKIPEKYAIVDTTGTTADVSVITDHAITVCAFYTGAPTTAPQLTYSCRLRFVG